MGFIGIEEIFLDVQDLGKALDFYHRGLGIPLSKNDDERAYLQCERGHLVLQVKNHGGRHRGGGPMHFAFTVSEETFDDVAENFVGSSHFTRGPMGSVARVAPCSSWIRTGTRQRSTPVTSTVCPSVSALATEPGLCEPRCFPGARNAVCHEYPLVD